jgi:hypothetical protein
MKCYNSTFDAQRSRIIIVVVQVGAVKIYVAALKAVRKNERQDESQFISFCKIVISSYPFDALLCRNWPFSPPNRVTLRI